MFHSLLRLLLLLLFVGFVPVGCIDCPPNPDYAELREFTFSLSEQSPDTPPFDKPPLANGTRTSAAVLYARIEQLQYEAVALVSAGPLFAGQALAWSCDKTFGYKGLKDPVAAVVLTSTGLFNGVPAGQSLTQFVRCRNAYGLDTTSFSLLKLPEVLNHRRGSGELVRPLVLRLSPKPRDNTRHQFELRIKLMSGKEVVQTTPEIIWE